MSAATCSSCGAPVIWAETVNGHPMPIDLEARADGNIELVERETLPPVALYVKVTQPTLGDAPRFVSHFATCPDATEWRKRR